MEVGDASIVGRLSGLRDRNLCMTITIRAYQW
jgi:hypothetical protein